MDSLGKVTLKNNEIVECARITAPTPDWCDQLEGLLGHKDPIWKWQNKQCLRRHLGPDFFFYILHRDGIPFSNIMTAELDGIGSLGHVWTVPGDRRKGAIKALMTKVMDDFQKREGRILTLGTDYDSPAYHIYRSFGFKSTEPLSGAMEYYNGDQHALLEDYFQESDATLEPLNWKHWAVCNLLFQYPAHQVVRCSICGPGRFYGEGVLLPYFQEAQEENKPIRGTALRSNTTDALVGFACWNPHPLWPKTHLIDLFCHPRFWHRGVELLQSLTPSTADRWIAYADCRSPERQEALEQIGFSHVVTHKDMAWTDLSRTETVDVIEYSLRP